MPTYKKHLHGGQLTRDARPCWQLWGSRDTVTSPSLWPGSPPLFVLIPCICTPLWFGLPRTAWEHAACCCCWLHTDATLASPLTRCVTLPSTVLIKARPHYLCSCYSLYTLRVNIRILARRNLASNWSSVDEDLRAQINARRVSRRAQSWRAPARVRVMWTQLYVHHRFSIEISAFMWPAEQTATVSVNSVKQMETLYVSFEAGTEFVNIMYNNFVLRRFKSQWLPYVPPAFDIRELL
jgi:hypothetical protein